jgi:hypothetical protein
MNFVNDGAKIRINYEFRFNNSATILLIIIHYPLSIIHYPLSIILGVPLRFATGRHIPGFASLGASHASPLHAAHAKT